MTKGNPRSERKYFQIIYVIRDYYPEYTKKKLLELNNKVKKWAKNLNM